MTQNLNVGLQNSILKLLILDPNFIKLVAGDLKTEYFGSIISRKIAQICLDYYAHYKTAPEQHFNDEIHAAISHLDTEEKQDYVDFIQRLEGIAPNFDYVLSRVSSFVKQREFENSAIKFAELTADEDFDDAEALMYQTLKKGMYEKEEAFDYLTDFSNLEKRGEAETYLMKTGIAALDKLVGGYKRGELLCTMGGYKGKKTWFLLHLAKTAVQEHGLNVIYFSHEVSELELEMRLDMMISKRASQEKYFGTVQEYPIYDPKTKQIQIQPEKARSIYNPNIVKFNRGMFGQNQGQIKFKKYPMGTCSIERMENYIDYLEQFHDFIPDVVITDYVEIMDLSKYGNETRHQINQGYIKLKGLADERNVFVATVSQVTTGALEKEKITMKDIAEDRRKVGNVDLMLAVSGTNEQDKLGMGRVTIIATRSRGDMGQHCMYSHCLPIGQFAISSWLGDDLTRAAFEAFGEDI